MSDLAYFEYALVLPEERYLIEVQTRNLATGETRGHDELQSVAKQAMITVLAKHMRICEKTEAKPDYRVWCPNLTKVQQLYLVPIAPSSLWSEPILKEEANAEGAEASGFVRVR